MDTSVFAGKRIFLTGATGLIGKAIVRRLLTASGKKTPVIIALVRDENRARDIFDCYPADRIEYVVGDVTSFCPSEIDVDYVIHGASNTSSKAFVDSPVNIIDCAVNGTRNMLELSRLNNVKGMVFLSTMEVYGAHPTDEKVTESTPCYLDTMTARASYAEGKRAAEALCAAYAAQYGVPAEVVRLTQTFGRGVSYDDGRVFAQFARCAIEGKDIVLKTKGETKRNYLYTDDAADAVLTVLYSGAVGEAYNAANDTTYCSIYEMAELVAGKIAAGKICVRIDESDVSSCGYAPTLKTDLCVDKLRALGWRPTADLTTMFNELVDDMRKSRK